MAPSSETAATASTAPAGPEPARDPIRLAAAAAQGRWWLGLALVLALVLAAAASAAIVMAWSAQQRVKLLEAELVKRQHDSSAASGEALVLSRQAEATAREAAAKMALLEVRVSETVLQRSQLEDLIQSLARSRDENVLGDVETAVRVAQQHSALTGSAEPLLQALRQAEERLARYNQPRLERVRRAVLQDLDRTRSAGVSDIAVLTIRLDEVIRQVDDLPLLVSPAQRQAARRTPAAAAAAPAASAASAASAGAAGTPQALLATWSRFADQVWHEVRALVRVTRIDEPEAMLIAPEQAYFLRENLKLRLLSARLALLSRQFDAAQSNMRDSIAALERYFDRSARRTAAATESLRQVLAQTRSVTVPRPDATLAAIAAAAAGR